MNMDKKIIQALEHIIELSGTCCKKANDLTRELSEMGFQPKIKRVSHRLNIFGDRPFYCEHINGEVFIQHFVVEIQGNILDTELGVPVPIGEYLIKTYSNFEDLVMA